MTPGAHSATRLTHFYGLREVGHRGDVQRFEALLYAIPEKKFAVAVLSNGENENASDQYIALARKVYEQACAFLSSFWRVLSSGVTEVRSENVLHRAIRSPLCGSLA